MLKELNWRAYAIGSGIGVVGVFAYGLKTNRSWKYYLVALIFIPGALGGLTAAIAPNSNKYKIPPQEETNNKNDGAGSDLSTPITDFS